MWPGMSQPTNSSTGDILDTIRTAIEAKLEGSAATVRGGGGHFEIEVTSAIFANKSTLEKQRLVYSAIAPLMTGDAPPVHAIDSLVTKVPASNIV